MHIVGFSFGDADFSSHVQHGARACRKDASLIRPFGGTTDGFLRHSPLSSSMSGEPVMVDNTGRTWPRITKDNAAQHPYPSLRHCKERGPGTAPYCWYLQISGEPTWDQEYTSFKKMKDMWDGWTGKNERRAQARRESAQQQETDRQGHRDSYRDAAAASRAATNAASTALLPHEEAQASILESRAGAMAATLLGAVGADGLVPFKPMVLGFERRRHESCRCARNSGGWRINWRGRTVHV